MHTAEEERSAIAVSGDAGVEVDLLILVLLIHLFILYLQQILMVVMQ